MKARLWGLTHKLAALAVVAGAMVSRDAWACGSCRGPGGAGSAVTAPWQRWGVTAAQTLRLGHGIWNDRGKYTAFGSQSRDEALDVAFGGGFRPRDDVELAAFGTFGHANVVGPDFAQKRAAFGDVSLRARWEIVSEPAIDLPKQPTWPSLGLNLNARLPTGTVELAGASGGGPSAGTVGSTATSLGLGTVEVALSTDIRKTFAQKVQLAAIFEGALRAPDKALGIRRGLAPRWLARAMALYFVTNDITAGLFVDLSGEGNVSYGGRTAERSFQRAFTVGGMASMKHDSGFRAGLSLGWGPPIDALPVNVVGMTTMTIFLGFTR